MALHDENMCTGCGMYIQTPHCFFLWFSYIYWFSGGRKHETHGIAQGISLYSFSWCFYIDISVRHMDSNLL